MVIIGYYGIGKSAVSQDHFQYVDLESKYFRADDAWIGAGLGLDRYIWLIEDLNSQGKDIFVSPLKEVCKGIRDSEKIDNKRDVLYVYPDVSLKDKWLSRLYFRWKDSKDQKDWYAYERATRQYADDINRLKLDPGNVNRVVITEENMEGFDLYKAIKEVEKNL